MNNTEFETTSININTTGLLKRLKEHQAQVSILVLNTEGKWVLGQKPNFYPAGIVRLLGGGVDPGEDFLTAAQRELLEETGAVVEPGELIPLIQLEVHAESAEGEEGYASFPVFLLKNDHELFPNDDVKEFAYLSDEDLGVLIEAYRTLSTDPVSGEGTFTWSDYGKIWAEIHQLALTKARALIGQ